MSEAAKAQRQGVETLPPSDFGKTRDHVASAIGIGSGRTYDKAAKVWAAAIERERARRRQAEAGKANLPTVSSGNVSLTHEEKGQTRDRVASAIGIGSGRTYDKAAQVWEADEGATESHQRHRNGVSSHVGARHG